MYFVLKRKPANVAHLRRVIIVKVSEPLNQKIKLTFNLPGKHRPNHFRGVYAA